VTTCNVKIFTYDTGRSPGLVPPAGAALGKHFVWVEVFDAATGGPAAPNNSASQPYTILTGKPFVIVSPISGLPTAHFTVTGRYTWSGACPTAAIPITFKFYWYKVSSTKVQIWTKTASSCAAGIVSTGASPPLTPPPGLNYPSTFVIQIAVFQSSGAAFGTAYTNTQVYQVLIPPSPQATPSSSTQCGLPGQIACASPTPSGTPCTQPSAALPPAGPLKRFSARPNVPRPL
jgi:hypothetical protein